MFFASVQVQASCVQGDASERSQTEADPQQGKWLHQGLLMGSVYRHW